MQYQAPSHFLKDKIILVTGAGDGIGKAAAKAYAQHGASVILLGRTVHKLEQVYDEIVENNFPEPAIYPLNLEGATPKDYQDLADTIKENFGRLDGLLHNANFLGANTPIQHYDTELWYKVMQVNLNAPFIMTQALLPLMIDTADSSIVFTVDDRSTAYWGAYGISKAALTSFMLILADEMDTDKKVKVNAISPEPVRTGMRLKAFPGEDPNTLKNPDDIMPTYLYLMSTDCSKTGQIFHTQN
ncbi:MAG: YciK family oxidoreductase [Gammaproteobacteria bacterium]|nr:YciK family oxidoreductase [Gammaproteobacteria bacterium]MCW8909681.1 YciK family oxidoreductase [Gammaproteobacteria bacterium]MCW9005760.1 YciK family oxidoreductase [Gammaproteobacteria bacterium]